MMNSTPKDYERTNADIGLTGERFVPWVQDPIITYEHLHRYAFAKEFVEGKRVIDLASGEGYGSAMLAEIAFSVTGIDIDEASIRHATQKYLRPNLKFIQGSLLDIPVKGQGLFDVAVCFEALEHIADQAQLLKEVKRVLTKEGSLIISTPNKEIYSDNPDYQNPFHIKELYFGEFKNQLSDFFQHTTFLGQKVFRSSNIFPLEGSRKPLKSFAIDKQARGFGFVSLDKKPARYFIAVATDQDTVEDLLPGDSYLVDISDSVAISPAPTRSSANQSTEDPEEIYGDVQALIQSGRNDEAIRLLEKMIKSFPGIGLAYNDLGVLSLYQGDRDKARHHYEEAVRLQPANLIFLKNLADLYVRVEGRVREGLALFQKVLSIQPDDVEALTGIGTICAVTGKDTDAAFFFGKAFCRSVNDPVVLGMIEAAKARTPFQAVAAEPGSLALTNLGTLDENLDLLRL
ncbi:MAG: Lipopolysaccharide biosynthesis protein [Deltaproteobacteria bacterium]|nr:Lipopolysaccharide biosynthesis protein [Deltaproteobacteria bacterium]